MMFPHEDLTDVERGTEVTFTYTSNRGGNEITKTGVKTSDGHVDVDPENAEVYSINSYGTVEKSRKVGELVELEVHHKSNSKRSEDIIKDNSAVDFASSTPEGIEGRLASHNADELLGVHQAAKSVGRTVEVRYEDDDGNIMLAFPER